jgi:energy-coupling factor transporter ATP-binding protein EcfA2
VTEYTKKQWTAAIRNDFDVELVAVSREDILTELLKPINAPLCRDLLGISVPAEPGVDDLVERVCTAAREIRENWRTHARLAGKPVIPLKALVLDQSDPDLRTPLSIEGLHHALRTGGRIVLEGIAGAGKTTTLTELAGLVDQQGGGVALLVDLPDLLGSGRSMIEFLASRPQFLARGISAEKLANALNNVSCSFLVNGWNEVSEAFSEAADGKLREIDRDFPTAGILVATRARQIRPPLQALRARLLPVSRAQRSEYIHQVAAGPGKRAVSPARR